MFVTQHPQRTVRTRPSTVVSATILSVQLTKGVLHLLNSTLSPLLEIISNVFFFLKFHGLPNSVTR